MRPLILIIPILFFTSCVKEELPECPGAQLLVTLGVKDINYSNASDLGLDMIDENLPFKQYIPNYYYILKDINSGSIVANSSLITVSGDEKKVSFTIDNIPDGEYELTAWGNIKDNQPGESGVLHRDGTEDSDLYFVVDTVLVATGASASSSLDLARTKGKLLVIFNNLPNEIVRVSERITNIYQNRSAESYSGTTAVDKVFTRASGQLDQLETFLAPSVLGAISTLSLSLYFDDNDTHIVDPIEIAIKQNEVTAVRLDYNDMYNDFEISVYINNRWVVIKALGLT